MLPVEVRQLVADDEPELLVGRRQAEQAAGHINVAAEVREGVHGVRVEHRDRHVQFLPLRGGLTSGRVASTTARWVGAPFLVRARCGWRGSAGGAARPSRASSSSAGRFTTSGTTNRRLKNATAVSLASFPRAAGSAARWGPGDDQGRRGYRLPSGRYGGAGPTRDRGGA